MAAGETLQGTALNETTPNEGSLSLCEFTSEGGAKVFAELDRGLKLDHKDFFVYDDFVI